MGLSGGVDSSVSAALLQEQGYDVIGVYILGWTGTKEFPCNWQQEEADARAVAEQLNIPFYTVNLAKEYEQAVIDEFFAVYQAGGTPNPDILCNREIKFKALWQAVRQFEPDYIATGHYAQIKNGAIYKGADANKDQSYFLWGIHAAMLPHILFPVGGLQKAEVRQLAKRFNLPTATKKDSQGICFVGPLKVRQFLASRLQTKPGESYTTDGRFLANHDGVALYTIGQRLGAGSVSWTGDVPPLFVVAKDIAQNRLIVGSDEQTYGQELLAVKPNWLQADAQAIASTAKIRYRQEDVAVTITPDKGETLRVSFAKPVRAITSGQSIVFYSQDDQLLGGAYIAQVPSQDQCIAQVNERQNQTHSQKASTTL